MSDQLKNTFERMSLYDESTVHNSSKLPTQTQQTHEDRLSILGTDYQDNMPVAEQQIPGSSQQHGMIVNCPAQQSHQSQSTETLPTNPQNTNTTYPIHNGAEIRNSHDFKRLVLREMRDPYSKYSIPEFIPVAHSVYLANVYQTDRPLE